MCYAKRLRSWGFALFYHKQSHHIMDRQSFDAFIWARVKRKNHGFLGLYTKADWPENVKTQSSNPAVLELYAFLVKNEEVDSDYWQEGYGGGDCRRLIERTFKPTDWEALKLDIGNWTNYQLEIFVLCIMLGHVGSDKVPFNGKEFGYDNSGTISVTSQQLALLPTIISMSYEKERQHNEIRGAVMDNIFFFTTIEGLPYELIHEIAEKVGYFKALEEGWELWSSDTMENIAYALKHAKR